MVEFRILGPLEAVKDDGPLALGGPKQRALLAVLLVHRGEVVSLDRLIDALWGERPPATAGKTAQVYISNLRKALGDGQLITRERGYVLELTPGQVDLDRFETLAAEGRQALEGGDAARASGRLRDALALWRGPALADFAYERFAQSEVARLEEERLAALEDRIDADVALGKHTARVGELEALVREHPFRERLYGQLMLALYRSGRQAEALERYQEARRVLIDELGIEPGPGLKELERAILAQDPSLGPTPRPSPIAKAIPRRSGLRIMVVGAAVLLVAAITAVLLSGGGGGSLGALQANSLGLIDAATGHLRASISTSGTPARVRVSGRQVWVTSDDARTVSLVDAGTPSVTRVVPIGAFPSDFAVGERALWAIDRVTGRLVKVSPDYATALPGVAIGSSETVSTTDDRYGPDPWSIAAGAGGVWITDGSSLLRRAEPSSGRIVHAYDVDDALNGVAVGFGAVWAISGSSDRVLRIDARSGRVTERIPIVATRGAESPYPIEIATGLGSVWVLNGTAASVTRIDPVQGEVMHTIPIGLERVPRRLAVGAGAAWVADGDGTLTRIDASTNTPTTEPVAHSLYDVAVGAGGVWVTAGPAGTAGSVAAGNLASAQAHALPNSQCSPIYSAPGARPRYLIASDLPLGGDSSEHDPAAQVQQAIVFELRERGFRAGRFTLGYQACDDANLAPGSGFPRCGPNMRAYAADRSVIGVIGPFNSPCASAEIAIANRAPGGRLAMISPSTTSVGLTHIGPGSQPREPGIYYPTGQRNFVRIVPADDVQAAADVVLARRLGLHHVFVAHDDIGPYELGVAQSFAINAKRLGLGVAGTGMWPAPVGTNGTSANRPAIAAFVRTVARTQPDGIFLGGIAEDPSIPPLIQGLRAAIPHVQLMGGDGFAVFPQLPRAVGPALEGMTISDSGIAPSLLTGPGRQFAAQFGKQISGTFYPWTAYGAQATDVLLDAIARSNGTRASVTTALFATHIRNGIIGSFAFTSTGDTTAGTVTIIRVQGGKQVPWLKITPRTSVVGSR